MKTNHYKKRHYNVNVNMLTATEVYQQVFSGKRSRFPAGFWSEEGNIERAIEITKYFFEKILEYSREDICTKLDTQTFYKHCLCGMIKNVFNNSVFKTVDAAYPGEYKPWELKRTHSNCWNSKQRGKEAICWLIEEKLRWSDKQVCDNLTLEIFKNNGLSGMMSMLYNDSPYLAIESAYPGKYKPWELPQGYIGIWEKEERKVEAIRWLIEEKLKWNHEKVCLYFSNKVIKENKLDGLATVHYLSCPYEMLEAAYPGEYKPWQLQKTRNKFWKSDENIEEAITWLKNKCPNPNEEDFKENGLGGVLNHKFQNSVKNALEFKVKQHIIF